MCHQQTINFALISPTLNFHKGFSLLTGMPQHCGSEQNQKRTGAKLRSSRCLQGHFIRRSLGGIEPGRRSDFDQGPSKSNQNLCRWRSCRRWNERRWQGTKPSLHKEAQGARSWYLGKLKLKLLTETSAKTSATSPQCVVQ